MIKFAADNTRISGPRVDGTMSITFETGEYEKNKVLDVMKLHMPVHVYVLTEEEYAKKNNQNT